MGFKTKNIVVGGKEIKSDPPTLNVERWICRNMLQYYFKTPRKIPRIK